VIGKIHTNKTADANARAVAEAAGAE
jgi:hypothetical protein